MQREGVKKYAGNTVWVFSALFLRLLSGILVGVWLVRYLGPNKLGIFNYALAFNAIFLGLAQLGLESIVIRDILGHPEQTALYMGTTFRLKFFASLATIAIMAICSWLAGNDFTLTFYILIIATGMIWQSLEVIDLYFQAMVQSKYSSLGRIIQIIITSILKIIFILIHADLIYFVIVSMIDQVLLGFFYLAAYKHAKGKLDFLRQFDWTIAKSLLKSCWPLVFGSITIAIYSRIDQIMIKPMLGATSLGLFSAAIKFTELSYLIPQLAADSFFPAIVNAKNRNQEQYRQRLLFLMAALVWGAVFIAVLTTLFGKALIVFMYGSVYRESGTILVITIWTLVFASMNLLTNLWLMVEHRTQIILVKTLCGAVASIVLNLLFIPRYGIIGSAYAMLLAQFTVAIITDWFYPATREILVIKIKAFDGYRLGKLILAQWKSK